MLKGKYYLDYLYLDPSIDLSVCSSKNMILEDKNKDNILETCRVEGNIIIMAYTKPLDKLYAFLTGASLFS